MLLEIATRAIELAGIPRTDRDARTALEHRAREHEAEATRAAGDHDDLAAQVERALAPQPMTNHQRRTNDCGEREPATRFHGAKMLQAVRRNEILGSAPSAALSPSMKTLAILLFAWALAACGHKSSTAASNRRECDVLDPGKRRRDARMQTSPSRRSRTTAQCHRSEARSPRSWCMKRALKCPASFLVLAALAIACGDNNNA